MTPLVVKISVLFSSCAHSKFTFSLLFLLLFLLHSLYFSFTGKTTSSPLQNSSAFPYTETAAGNFTTKWGGNFMSNRLVGEAPGARRRWTMPLCVHCLASQQLRSKHSFSSGALLQSTLLEHSLLSQTSVSQKVCLRSGETSLGHDKEKTDFEVFLTYISSMFLFVFFEVESKREGTTVWLLHESLENERISQKKHCS